MKFDFSPQDCNLCAASDIVSTADMNQFPFDRVEIVLNVAAAAWVIVLLRSNTSVEVILNVAVDF